jgi:hypothetical protein
MQRTLMPPFWLGLASAAAGAGVDSDGTLRARLYRTLK